MVNQLKFIFLLLFSLLLLGCNSPSRSSNFIPTVIETINPSPTSIPTPTATLTPSPTPTPLPAYRILSGDKALENGDWDKASEEYNSALNGSQDENIQFNARLGLARTALYAKNMSTAISEFEQLIIEFPQTESLADVYFLLGQAYVSSGRYVEAVSAYDHYLSLRHGVIDGYVHDLRGDALFASGNYLEAANAYNNALQSISQLDQIFIQMKLARSLALGGDVSNALTLYDSIYSQTNNPNTRALINLRKGQILTEAKKIDEAYLVYQDSVNNYPTAYESYTVLILLVEAGIPVNELKRGMVDFYAGQYGVALAAFERYLRNNPADPATALYFTGLANQAVGKYTEAISTWDKVINNYPDHPYWDEAWEQKGFTQWYYLDDYLEAEKTFLGLPEKIPTHPRAAEFIDDAARVAERRNDLVRAAELWRKLAIQYPEDERALNSLFLAALAHYRMKDYPSALQDFKGYFGISKLPFDRSRAMFWIGKTLQSSGDTNNALQTWQETASIDPTGYYSERANDLLLNRQAFSPPDVFDLGGNLENERQQAEAWLRTTFLIPETTDLSGLGKLASDPAIIRGKELWNLGLKDQARLEFEAVRIANTSDAEASYRLANYFNDIGLYRSAVFAARQVLTLAGMDDATSLTGPFYINRIRFGTHYSELIFPIAREYGFHPLFLFSVVRQESLFETFASSSAAAKGLMQIIPSTGLEIATELGLPENYSVDDLNRPIINLKFGAKYLSKQLNAFQGDMYAALAAYNGGPGNAQLWKDLAPDDPDLFLELIRFSETREYIRRIYEIFSIYRRLYARSP